MNRLHRTMSGIFMTVPPGASLPGGTSPAILPQGTLPAGQPMNSSYTPPSPAGRRMTYEEALAQMYLNRHQCIDGGNHMLPDTGPVAGVFMPTFVVKDPALDMPREGEEFDFDKPQGVVAAPIIIPAVGFPVVVVSFQVPPRKIASIEFIANQIIGGGIQDGSGTFFWQILVDTVPARNYERIFSSRGSPAQPGSLGRGYIPARQNQLVQLVFNNVSIAPGGQNLIGLLRGHYRPIDTRGWRT